MSTSGSLVILRHGERLDYTTRESGGNWTATASRPYDTPLTPVGIEQGRLAGIRIAGLLSFHSLPPPTRVFTSPMLRCAETLSSALAEFPSVTSMSIEHGLTESCNLDWYRSWSLPSSDSTWGGPPGVREEPSDARAFANAAELLGTPEYLNSQETVTVAVTPRTSVGSVSQYSYARPESRAGQFARLRAAAQGLAASGETILLCSHGGPCTHLFEELTGKDWKVAGECGFTAISVYKWEKKGGDDEEWKWECLEINDCGHLGGEILGGIIE